MDLHASLATLLLREHPVEAARALEQLPPHEAAGVLAGCDPEIASEVLSRLATGSADPILDALDATALAAAVAQLAPDRAARLIRRIGSEKQSALYRAMPDRLERSVRSLLRYAEDSAGSLMDPDVLALPADLTVQQAIERIRATPAQARYNVYVTDAEQKLVGVVNLREILLASPRDSLESIMHREVHRIAADADRRAIASHPGWRTVHALPVVGPNGEYLGAIRYRMLRRIERELAGTEQDSGTTARALGDLFATGAVGLLEAVIGTARDDGRHFDGA